MQKVEGNVEEEVLEVLVCCVHDLGAKWGLLI